jgi:hypothetical protein
LPGLKINPAAQRERREHELASGKSRSERNGKGKNIKSCPTSIGLEKHDLFFVCLLAVGAEIEKVVIFISLFPQLQERERDRERERPQLQRDSKTYSTICAFLRVASVLNIV